MNAYITIGPSVAYREKGPEATLGLPDALPVAIHYTPTML